MREIAHKAASTLVELGIYRKKIWDTHAANFANL